MILALAGPAGCGKSTAATYLAERHGFARVRFAGPLKAMLRALLASAGLPEVEIERRIEGDLKEHPCATLGGRSPRYAMQHLGTAYGREILSPTIWTDAWRSAVLKALKAGAPGVVAEDCRFQNEAQAVLELGGRVLRIERPGAALIAGQHISETGFAEGETILNEAGTKTLFARIDAALAVTETSIATGEYPPP